MEKRKVDMQVAFEKLNNEWNTAISLLNQLMQKCTHHMNSIANLDSQQLRLYSKYFVMASQFQYSSYQKVMEWNIDLEEFLREHGPLSFERFKLSKSPSPRESECSVASVSYPETLGLQSTITVEEETTQASSVTPQIVSEQKEPETELRRRCLSSSTLLTEISTSDDYYTVTSGLDESADSDYYNLSNLSNEEVTVLHQKVAEDLPQRKETCTNITESLKPYTLKSQQKHLEEQKRAPMPDITLRRATTSSNGAGIAKENVKTGTKKKLKSIDNKGQVVEVKERDPPKVGDRCLIGYAISPAELYIQVVDENSTYIDMLSMELANIYKNSSFHYTSKAGARTKLGNWCALIYDNEWYRAEVLDWMLDDECNEVLVKFIDYGDNYGVHYSQLWPLPRHLCTLPKIAQRCHLGYLHPADSTKGRRLKKWTKESIDGFLSVLGDLDTNMFIITHVFYCKEKDSFEIDLIEENCASDEKSIGEVLIEMKLAVEIIDYPSEVVKGEMAEQIRRAHGMQGIEPQMTQDQILEKFFEQNMTVEAANVNEAVIHYDPRDEALTCRIMRRDGTCARGEKCRFRHIPLRDGFTLDRELVYNRAFVNAYMPAAGEEVVLTITHIVDIRRFYAQIRNVEESFGQRLSSLTALMNKPDMVKQYQKLRQPPARNQLVIAPHWNGSWYRAQVRDVTIPENTEDVSVEVYIVDFGEPLRVPMRELREIMPEFLNLSFQATECRLYNVKEKEGVDSDDATKHFENHYQGLNFNATVVAAMGHLEVVLKDNHGQDLGLQLIGDGFAELNTDQNRWIPIDETLLID